MRFCGYYQRENEAIELCRLSVTRFGGLLRLEPIQQTGFSQVQYEAELVT